MKKILLPFLCLFSTQAVAGNVMELLTRDMSGKELERMTSYTEGTRSRMDQTGADGSFSIIFLDDEFLYLDHAQKNYMVMDEAMLEGVSQQINEAMKEMEAELANLPPEQRAMVEEMMKGQMGSMGVNTEIPVLEIRNIGSDSYQSYDCTLVEMLEDGTKIQEICSVDFSEVDGSGELRDSFIRMGTLLSKLYDSMPFNGEGIRNPMEMLDEMEGFPVRAVEFENGKAVRETVLESSEEKDIDGDMFELPSGYSRIDPLAP
ncbi:MAG: hypothetical protein AAFX56_14250 [Pseudomonadota bacterium]